VACPCHTALFVCALSSVTAGSRALPCASDHVDLPQAIRVKGRQPELSVAQIAARLIFREHKGSSFHPTVNGSDRKTFSLYKGRQSTGVAVSNRIEIKVISTVHPQLVYLKFASLPPLTAVV